MAICTKCRQQIETPGLTGLCYGCYLDSLIPFGHEEREHYVKDDSLGHVNATATPSLGSDFLNSTPERLRAVSHYLNGRPMEYNGTTSLREFLIYGLAAHRKWV